MGFQSRQKKPTLRVSVLVLLKQTEDAGTNQHGYKYISSIFLDDVHVWEMLPYIKALRSTAKLLPEFDNK